MDSRCPDKIKAARILPQRVGVLPVTGKEKSTEYLAWGLTG